MEDSEKKKDGKDEKAEGKALEVVGEKAIAEPELTPAEMKAQLIDMNEKRKIFQQFVKDQIKEKVHSYKVKKSAKPSLSKPGGLLLCSLYRVTPTYDTRKEIHGQGGTYAAFVKCRLISNKTGKKIAEGEGCGSTQEVKYKYRWVYERDIPPTLDKTMLMTRTGENYKQFRIENEEPEDLHNTVLKMAQKRAMVAAALNLPYASEAFTQDLEEPAQYSPEGGEEASGKEEAPAAASESISGAQQRMLHGKFDWLGTSDEDRKQFLKSWYPNSAGHIWDDKTKKGLTKKEASELVETFINDVDLIKNALKSSEKEKK